jgi:hypothetical protein
MTRILYHLFYMSGSFERLGYDEGAYQRELQQSTAPLSHIMDPSAVNRCNPCRVPEPGYIGKVGVSLTHQRPLIDVESDLKLLNYPATRDPNQQFTPTCPKCGKCNEGYPCGGGVVADCCNCQEELYHLPMCDMSTEYTRISNPICTSRGVGVNRFQPLCLNPQDENRWLHPSEVGINYRNVVKDNHVPCVPRPIDPTPLLPKGGDIATCPRVEVCGVYMDPMHSHGKLDKNWNQ